MSLTALALDNAAPGSCVLEVSGDPDSEAVSSLGTALADACGDAVDCSGLSLGGLRAFVVGADFGERVRYWQGQAGQQISGTSTSAHGLVVGKTITWWRDGDARSVIILEQSLAALLLGGWLNAPALPKISVLHELAHVHEGGLRGPDGPPPAAGDIAGIRATAAKMLWSEYFAERVAARHADRDYRDNFAGTAEILRDMYERVAQMRPDIYGAAGPTGVFRAWAGAAGLLCDASQAIGRFLGCVADDDTSEVRMRFLEGLSFAPVWRSLAKELDARLKQLYSEVESPSMSTVEILMPRLWEGAGIFIQDGPGGVP